MPHPRTDRRFRGHPSAFWGLVGSGLMALLLGGCPPIDQCNYEGKTYRVGETFPATDGCNSCSCTEGGSVACTLIACLPPPGGCRHTGCSGQLCSDHDVASTCEFRDEYACYQAAVCARQPNGTCGFTPSEALMQCLAHGGSGDGGVTPDAGLTSDAGTSDAGTRDTGTVSDAAPGGDAASSCDFASSYEYGRIGGFVAWNARSYLSPGNHYRYVRTPVRGAGTEASCAPVMPACGALDVITAYDIEAHDLTNADVRAAMAEPSPPLFGYDQRPVDGQVFEFKTSAGASFLIGADCAGRADCRAIPAGVKQLRDRLLALDAQQLAAPACKAAGLSP